MSETSMSSGPGGEAQRPLNGIREAEKPEPGIYSQRPKAEPEEPEGAIRDETKRRPRTNLVRQNRKGEKTPPRGNRFPGNPRDADPPQQEQAPRSKTEQLSNEEHETAQPSKEQGEEWTVPTGSHYSKLKAEP